MAAEHKDVLRGPYAPTLIIHGGAGNITRKNLPPDLYEQYKNSLLKYLHSTRDVLLHGASALDAAVHAVALMEDDPLFNCGRGSVFTETGTIEMEASVMVASVDPERARDERLTTAHQKRGAGVSLLKNTRHPIQLAREALLIRPNGTASSMHCQLSGPELEQWGWQERGLERKEDDWFWTKKRWDEHRRGLQMDSANNDTMPPMQDNSSWNADQDLLPSQGTVGTVCMDSFGDLCVATSTGGLTNKKAGRLGDTATFGAGFWAENWEDTFRNRDLGCLDRPRAPVTSRLCRAIEAGFSELLGSCLPSWFPLRNGYESLSLIASSQPMPRGAPPKPNRADHYFTTQRPDRSCRAVAVSGTGNGDSFLRTAACRTTAALCRYSRSSPSADLISLKEAMDLVAGPGGELQDSAGDRWAVTGEGQAGIIGIEVKGDSDAAAFYCSPHGRRSGRVLASFNCGGLWRAWFDEKTGTGKVMVFRDEY